MFSLPTSTQVSIDTVVVVSDMFPSPLVHAATFTVYSTCTIGCMHEVVRTMFFRLTLWMLVAVFVAMIPAGINTTKTEIDNQRAIFLCLDFMG